MLTFLLSICTMLCLGLGFGACSALLPTWIGAPALIGAIVLLMVIDYRLTHKTILALLIVGLVLLPAALFASEFHQPSPCCTLPGCTGPTSCSCPSGCCEVKQAKPTRYVNARPRLFKRLLFARRR